MGKNLKGKECGKGIYQRIENIVCDLAPNTKRNYQERYNRIENGRIDWFNMGLY